MIYAYFLLIITMVSTVPLYSMDHSLWTQLQEKKRQEKRLQSKIQKIKTRLAIIEPTYSSLVNAPHGKHSPAEISTFYDDIAQEIKDLTSKKTILISQHEKTIYEIDQIEKPLDHP